MFGARVSGRGWCGVVLLPLTGSLGLGQCVHVAAQKDLNAKADWRFRVTSELATYIIRYAIAK